MHDIRPLCQHCRKRKVNRPKGLCWSCYYSPGVRDLYPSTSKFARRVKQDFNGDIRLPVVATDAAPGSAEKLLVMESRAAAGVSLFHPQDTRVDWRTPRSVSVSLVRMWQIRHGIIEKKENDYGNR